MLGEKIGEFGGKNTGRRVISVTGGTPTIEVSIEQQGKLLGTECTDTGTYTSVLQPDGSLKGKGHGIVMTKDGEVATWEATGVGKLVPGKNGAVAYRGSLVYQTASPKLSRLNGLCVIFEHDAQGDGSCGSRLFEWR